MPAITELKHRDEIKYMQRGTPISENILCVLVTPTRKRSLERENELSSDI